MVLYYKDIMNNTENNDKKLLVAYRNNNLVLQDKLEVKEGVIKELQELVEKKERELTAAKDTISYWVVKFNKKNGWFF